MAKLEEKFREVFEFYVEFFLFSFGCRFGLGIVKLQFLGKEGQDIRQYLLGQKCIIFKREVMVFDKEIGCIFDFGSFGFEGWLGVGWLQRKWDFESAFFWMFR